MLLRLTLMVSVAGLACWASSASAQGAGKSPLLSLSQSEMRAEIDKRYDAAVKLTQTPAIINAAIMMGPDPRKGTAAARAVSPV